MTQSRSYSRNVGSTSDESDTLISGATPLETLMDSHPGELKAEIYEEGGQVFMRKNSQDAIREFRPYFDHAPVYGGGPSLEEFMDQTPLTVGSPQQVIDKTLKFREYFGDYQRQLFLMDHAGLPLKTVLEQMDMLGEQVIPVLRREFAALRPAHVPDAPTHASLKAAAEAAHAAAVPEGVK